MNTMFPENNFLKNALLISFLFVFCRCNNNKYNPCNNETKFISLSLVSNKAKELRWSINADTCNNLYTAKEKGHIVDFYQAEDSANIYRRIGKNLTYNSHSLCSDEIISNDNSMPQAYFYLFLNKNTKLLINKTLNINSIPISVYIYKESTGIDKVCYSFYTKKFSFFMYYNPDKDEIIYPIKLSKTQILLINNLLNDTTIFGTNTLIRDKDKKVINHI